MSAHDEYLAEVLGAAESWRIALFQECGRAHERGDYVEAFRLRSQSDSLANAIWQLTPDAEADALAAEHAREKAAA